MNRMTDDFRRDSAKDPAQLEREIDATRSELMHTLEELERRLSPGDMLNTVLSRVRRDGGEFAGNLGNSVKDHPLPALLAGIGIAWMMAANGRHHEERIDRPGGGRMRASANRMRERWHGARDSLKHGGESMRHGVAGARSSVSGSAQSVRRRAKRMSSAARRGAGHARSGVDYLWHEQPLLLGALGLAAGAIAGAALPPTEEEDKAFGELRDRTLDKARAAGAEGARQARERVEGAAEQATDRLRGNGHGAAKSSEHVETRPDTPETPTSTSSPETGIGY
ncbi:MAG: DUF3618 domain-containing protein [Gammaproteobacteria bacterium]|nr:DUF3618 domain-containing protein [Gammaproteobacteria bacterium]